MASIKDDQNAVVEQDYPGEAQGRKGVELPKACLNFVHRRRRLKRVMRNGFWSIM
jgi:hypothetical protein